MIFKKITIQNFFSFGPKPQTLDLSQAGLYLITGENKINEGSNGAGKSTVVEAICYALFGQVTKKVNIPQIINEQIGRDCMVELEFEVDGKNYIIERWKKQKGHYDKLHLFKNNKEEDSLISQANKGETQIQINEIIKFNYKSFINAIMMTQEQISGFLQAESSKKKEIIENILQLNVLTKYHWIAQQKRKIYKHSYDDMKVKTEGADALIENTKLAMKEYVDSCKKKKTDNKIIVEQLKLKLEKINTTDINAERAKIKKAEDLAKEQESLMIDYQHEADKLKLIDNERETIKSTQGEYDGLLKTANKTKKRLDAKKDADELKIAQDELQHVHDNPDLCPICSNNIESDDLKTWINAKMELINKIEETIISTNKQKDDNNENIINWTTKKDELKESIKELNKKYKKQEKIADKIKKEYGNMEIPETMDEDELNKLDEKIKELEQKIRDKENKEFLDKKYLNSLMQQAKDYANEKKNHGTDLKKLKHKFMIMKWWEDSLSSKKNSMKSWCINNVIGYFNSKIKYYIDRFFEGSVQLELDNDLNELISTNGNERSYDQFSGGEKRRLNLAILFALNDLVKSNISSKMNVMFLDEILSNYLDDKGISSVLEILQDMRDNDNSSVYVIDHKDNFKDYPSFTNIVIIKEEDGFSYIKQNDM